MNFCGFFFFFAKKDVISTGVRPEDEQVSAAAAAAAAAVSSGSSCKPRVTYRRVTCKRPFTAAAGAGSSSFKLLSS
jgi:hypothetical protein